MIGTLTFTTKTPIIPITATSSRQMSSTGRSFCRASATATPPPRVDTCKPAGSLYEVLRVKRNASPVQIKAAYRDLAKVYHPDSSRSDGRDFIEIREAYSTLSDPTARVVYDMKLAVGSERRTVGIVSRLYRTRRWETDQCW